jgi:hypothetical protein
MWYNEKFSNGNNGKPSPVEFLADWDSLASVSNFRNPVTNLYGVS